MNLIEKYSERLVQEDYKALVITEFICEVYSIQFSRDLLENIKGLVALYGADDVFLIAVSVASRYRKFRGNFITSVSNLLARILQSDLEKHLDKSMIIDLTADIEVWVEKVQETIENNQADEIIRTIFDE